MIVTPQEIKNDIKLTKTIERKKKVKRRKKENDLILFLQGFIIVGMWIVIYIILAILCF